MPERSLMYFFIFETTIRMSRSNSVDIATAPAGGGVATTRRGSEPDGIGGAGRTGCGVELGGGAGGTPTPAAVTCRTGGWRIVGPPAASSAATSAAHASRLGARASTAHASRWRRIATWLSQHATEQNTSLVRLRLQVDTLHTQCVAW